VVYASSAKFLQFSTYPTSSLNTNIISWSNKMSGNKSMTEDLIGWAHEHQTSLHSDVEVYQDPLTGLSFRARKSLPATTEIITCSYKTTLSYLNAITASSTFQNHQPVPFPPEFIDTLKQDDPNIIGHFFLVQQFLMRQNSFWWPYIKLLPQPDEPERLGIPIWWPEADQRFLDGTNAEPPIKKREEMWKAEWTKGVAHLRDRFENWEECTYPLYQWAATIFGSRSFRASLTIPEELVRQSQILPDDLSLTLDHIKKDRFSVLLPVMDIGNHNGANQVDWLPDPIAGHISLSIHDAISEGSQIFNYYGNKSNSELLVAYGFILPKPENEKVNLKLTPSPDAMQLRRSQFCHVIHMQPEQEFMFEVKTINETIGVQNVLKFFSEGLIDTIICMVANARERKFIIESPGYCIEKVPDPFGGPLSKAFIQALSILCEKLDYETRRIVTSGAKLG
jgi:protein-histidine N-methyltransferase